MEIKADVSFELTQETRTWLWYQVKDVKRGDLGTFRVNRETHYCDERDEHGELMLGEYFSGLASIEEFIERHELLNWIFDVFAGFAELDQYPPYHFVSS